MRQYIACEWTKPETARAGTLNWIGRLIGLSIDLEQETAYYLRCTVTAESRCIP